MGVRYRPFAGGPSIQTKVTADFELEDTARDILGNTFPSSGHLTVEYLEDDEVTRIGQGSGMDSLDANPKVPSHHPKENHKVITISLDDNFVDALGKSPNLNDKYYHRNGVVGLLVNRDGCFVFLSFVTTKPNSVPKPKKCRSSTQSHKYKFKTSITLDERCPLILNSDIEVLVCVNLCRVDHKLGNTYRIHRNGSLELVEDARPNCRGQKLRNFASNVVDPATTLLRVAGEATSFFPPVSAAIKGALALQMVTKASEDHQVQAQIELERVNKLLQDLTEFAQDAHGNRRQGIVHGATAIIVSCSAVRRALQPISEASRSSRVSRLDRDKDTIQEAKRDIDVADRDFAHLKASYQITSTDHLKQESETLVAQMADVQV